MAESKLSRKLRTELAARQRRRTPAQRMQAAQSLLGDAHILFNAGLKACGFSSQDIQRLWNRPSTRHNAAR